MCVRARARVCVCVCVCVSRSLSPCDDAVESSKTKGAADFQDILTQCFNNHTHTDTRYNYIYLNHMTHAHTNTH